jgi:hypothetical protein
MNNRVLKARSDQAEPWVEDIMSQAQTQKQVF